MKTGTEVGARGRCATYEGECRVAGARKTRLETHRASGERGDLRIRRKKKEQGREAGRYYEQCANRVRGFSLRPGPSFVSPYASLFLATFSSLFRLLLIFVYYSMETGRCSLIDGTGHGRTAARKKERKKGEKRGKRAEEEESGKGEEERNRNGRRAERIESRKRRRRAAAAGPPSPYL